MGGEKSDSHTQTKSHFALVGIRKGRWKQSGKTFRGKWEGRGGDDGEKTGSDFPGPR